MKYKWRLVVSKRKIIVISVAKESDNWNYFSIPFSDSELKMLKFLINELTYIPKGIGFQSLRSIQKKLGFAVWNKLV